MVNTEASEYQRLRIQFKTFYLFIKVKSERI